MNILIPKSWLDEYLETNASPQQFAEAMSLTSVSIERIEKVGTDHIYDIEVTTNRPDLMSIRGIAQEASAVLPQAGFKAIFKPHKLPNPKDTVNTSSLIKIKADDGLVNRITAVVMDIEIGPTPNVIKERLEKTGIRSLNNVIDVTNYIMREIGHPVHVFDYDRLTSHALFIRKSKKGEKLQTLDGLDYVLPGNDIIADDGTGKIVDLLGIMGTSNSVVTDNTKRILLFLDNNNPHLLRQTSMNLGIRTEAAIINEKGIDPELMIPTLMRGIELYKEIAKGKTVSDIIDIYPNKPTKKTVKVTIEKINNTIGIEIDKKTIISILENLGFNVTSKANELLVVVPSTRVNDVEIPEDIVEEVARVYGYHKIPNVLPNISDQTYYHQEENEFYWIGKIKEAMKFWGLNEIYSYSMVSEELFEGPIEEAVALKNPLTADHIYLRSTLTPSILDIARVNKNMETLSLFEISNVYLKKQKGLPDELLHMGGLIKKDKVSFYEGKGIVERILNVLGIEKYSFAKKSDGIEGAIVKVHGKEVGQIETDTDEVTFELNLMDILPFATSKKNYIEPSKFPPAIEDVRVEVSPHYTFKEIAEKIKETDERVNDVSLLDVFKDKKTFRITYLDRTKNLTGSEIEKLREKVFKVLETEFKAKIG